MRGFRNVLVAAMLFLSACANADGDVEYGTLAKMGAIIGTPIALLVWWGMASSKEQQRKLAAHNFKAGPVDAGRYVSGHPDVERSGVEAKIGIDANDFVFIDANARVLGRMPLGAPSEIEVVDASRVTTESKESISVTRVALFGVIGLAFPKTQTTSSVEQSYLVGLGWKYQGLAMTMSFAFTNAHAANRFAGFVAKNRRVAA